MPKQVPCLWYDTQAEEAAHLYVSLFPNSTIDGVTRYAPGSPGEPGTVMTVNYTLDGQEYCNLNGGPIFTFTEAVSIQIFTADQEETDRYWDGLLAGGGQESQCGWLKDRFGMSWQVIPVDLPGLIGDPDPERARRATAAMMKMQKIDIAELRRAADEG